jgi:hypothetical protein
MDDSLKLVKTNMGQPAVIHDGYFFVFSKNGADKKIWVCGKTRHAQCPARLHTTDSTTNPMLITTQGTHNHRADSVAVEVRATMGKIRSDAVASTSTPAQIISRNVQATSEAAQSAMPLIQNI